MLCPVCQETLLMTDRQGVEIDYCPKCRGIWLDRGELEKLIDRSVAHTGPPPSRSDRDPGPRDRQHDKDRHDEDRRRDSDSGHGRYKKRESWLSEIFDFG